MVQVKQAHEYELIFIVNPEVAEEALESVVNNVSQFIIGKGGTIVGTEPWGKKKLAYPLKHYLEGTYFLLRLKMDPAISKDVENHVKITEQIIRHILVQANS